MEKQTKKCRKRFNITITSDGRFVRSWNGPEFEKLKGRLGEEDDRREVLRGPRDLCG